MARHNAENPIRVLVAEGSHLQCELLGGLLRDGGFHIAGTVASGPEAVAAARRLRPDVITLDVALPRLDGYEAACRIMELAPTPVVLVTGAPVTHEQIMAALAAGAVSIVSRPRGGTAPDPVSEQAAFLRTVRLMADVLVVTRRPGRGLIAQLTPPVSEHGVKPLMAPIPSAGHAPQILAIAASTGGPIAVKTLLQGLGAGFPLPILLAQHISQGFVGSLADWLQKASGLPVTIARPSEPMLPGHVYLAPENHHLCVSTQNYPAHRPFRPEERYCPSGDVLFETVAAVYGRRAIGVILTGMGDDGARGMRGLRAAGGRTLAQDEASSVVYGMPRAAMEIGAAEQILPLAELAQAIRNLVCVAKR